MNLRSIFTTVVYKELALVDLPSAGSSHQHEVDGVVAIKRFFGKEETISGNISWYYFADNEETIHETGYFKFYDARARSAARTGRSEWRMYYNGEFLNNADAGDVLVLAKINDQHIYGLVFQNNSAWLRTARVAFNLDIIHQKLQLKTEEDLQQKELEFFEQQILVELGIEIELPTNEQDEAVADEELKRTISNGRVFPTTLRMAELAHSLVDVDIMNSDETLIKWLSKEEAIFRAMEKILVQQKLKTGFESVDEFISYSLSIQNRRKARMGYALQNHLASLFTARSLRFESQKTTEGSNRPDFLFPGQAEYHDAIYSTNLLVMLGVKSSCKDRWRQILTEAQRIQNKHLCTLEQAISVNQTNEMKVQNITLVLPRQLHTSFTPAQRKEIWAVEQFIEFVRLKQSF